MKPISTDGLFIAIVLTDIALLAHVAISTLLGAC